MATITKMDVMSYAKLSTVLNVFVGAILGIIYFLILLVSGNVAIGIAALIGTPIFLGIFGFITGAIGALIFNLAVKWSGGLELTIEK